MAFQHQSNDVSQAPGIRLHIAGRWSTRDMAAELAALDYLYNVACLTTPEVLPGIAARSGSEMVIYARADLLSPKSPYRQALIKYITREQWHPMLDATVKLHCMVRAVEYASPGFQDLAGIAAGFRVILEAVQYFCDRKRRQEKHDAEMTTIRLQQERMELENAQLYLKFLREARFSAKEQRRATDMFMDRQALLWSLVEQGKIRSIDDKT